MDTTKKRELLSQHNEKLVKARSVELCINQFKRKIREGPYSICTVCNRILYKKSVITYINKKYPCLPNIFQYSTVIWWEEKYVCNTCRSKVIKGKLSDQTCNQPPRPPDRSGMILLKLKRKLQFRGNVYFQAVRPELIQQVLNWLKLHNPLYKYILVDINNIDSNLTALQNDA